MISRHFERLAARLQGRHPDPPAGAGNAAGLQTGDRLLPWSEVRRQEAHERDTHVGDCLCLAIVDTGGRVFEITDASPGWEDVGKAIERFLPSALSHAEWVVG